MSLSLDNRVTGRFPWVNGLAVGLLIGSQTVSPVVRDVFAQPVLPTAASADSNPSFPFHLTCERIEFDQVTEEFNAFDAVTVTQGPVRLTADQATLHKLSGRLTARGRVHLNDRATDVWADELTVNLNTESGSVTNGRIFLKGTNTWVRGRLFQRFSETHYRVKDGTFTNCNAADGQIPDWSFSFHDVDVEQGDSVFAKNVWLHVRNYPIVPLPVLRYPTPGARQTGLLVPTTGFDNVFGFQYRQGFYWAVSPSQDLTVTPQILSERGQGGEVGYRYVLNRRSRGNWLVNAFHDTEEDQVRAQLTGTHVHQVHDALLMQAKINYATDRTFLQDLSSSGIFRSLPSQESILNVRRRLTGGSAYLKAQYLQPLNSGGRDTFQRLPEIGHRYRVFLKGDTFNLDVGMDSTFVHFVRDRGFSVSRFDVMPTVSVQGLHVGHMVGLRPHLTLREVLYSRGRAASQGAARGRGTVWLGFEAVSNVSRGFSVGTDHRLRHTIEPRLFYEYVPPSRQSDLPQIDATDNLLKKHLLTYSVKTGLKDEWSGKQPTTVAAFEIAQSYHLGDAPGRADVFSNVWARTTFEVPVTHLPDALSRLRLNVDAFYDPSDQAFTQLNSAIVVQAHRLAYADLGYRRTRAGTVPRRGDVWNPLSFNEVLAADSEIHFFAPGGAIRLPGGWTVGTRAYHDFATGQTPEWDVVGLYQNPCKCWSLGLYYIRLAREDDLPERNQFNFVLTLRGVGATPGFGTRILQSILGPLLQGEPGLPWSPN